MTLGLAAALLAAAMIGIALACDVYIGLTLLFVDAVRNSPPAA